MKARQLLRLLERELGYGVVRSTGSPRRLEADGRPPLLFAFHDRDTIPPGLVRKILVRTWAVHRGSGGLTLTGVSIPWEGMTMVKIDVIIHLEDVDGEVVWWAESPDVDGFSATGPTLASLRQRVRASLTEVLDSRFVLVENLGGDAVQHRRTEHTDAQVVQTDLVAC